MYGPPAWITLICLFILTNSALGGDNPPPETLPAPRPVPLEMPFPAGELPMFPAFERTNRYAVWQYYGVDRRGGFRPLVVYSPYGSYYLYNGKPFLYAPVRQLEIMPYIVD